MLGHDIPEGDGVGGIALCANLGRCELGSL